MPTYDYECNECGHVFEVFQTMSAEPVSVCEKCNGTVRRLISGGSGVIFKGSGYYVKDAKASQGKTENAASCSCSSSDSCPNSGN
ncbi:MAG: hypothetical protein JW982_03115 [Spirochaetes bacterium]|nr:hypothetical protein [Spirochaetota bacterium]